MDVHKDIASTLTSALYRTYDSTTFGDRWSLSAHDAEGSTNGATLMSIKTGKDHRPMTTVRVPESMVWFVDPISAALTQAAHWWRAVDLVGVYYRGNMAGLDQTTWESTCSATGDNRTDL